MRKFLAISTTGIFLTSVGLANDTYIVKFGDTLSRIVSKKFPSEKLYGRKGKLAEVLAQNPQIKNLNKIFPNQKIQFHSNIIIETPVAAESIIETPKVEELPQDRRVSETPGLEEWNISALFGAKYLSVSQSGALGKADLGVLFLNDLKLKSEFIFDDWSFGFQFDSYKFKYEALTSGDSKQMYALNLFGSYKWFLGGLNIEQNPLFRNNAGNVELTKMTVMSLSLGAKKDIELPTRKPTVLKLKGWVNYPFSSSSDNADIKLDSVQGFGLSGQAELNRQIFAKEDYSLHATWMTQVGYQQLTQDVEWDVSKGEVKSQMLNASTTLGLLFKF